MVIKDIQDTSDMFQILPFYALPDHLVDLLPYVSSQLAQNYYIGLKSILLVSTTCISAYFDITLLLLYYISRSDKMKDSARNCGICFFLTNDIKTASVLFSLFLLIFSTF